MDYQELYHHCLNSPDMDNTVCGWVFWLNDHKTKKEVNSIVRGLQSEQSAKLEDLSIDDISQDDKDYLPDFYFDCYSNHIFFDHLCPYYPEIGKE